MRRDSPRYGNFPKRRKSRERPWNRASPAFGKLWEHVGKYRVDLCEILECDIEYIFGLSDIKNKNTFHASSYLGLNQETIQAIKDYPDVIKELINIMVCDDGDTLKYILFNILQYVRYFNVPRMTIQTISNEKPRELSYDEKQNYIKSVTMDEINLALYEINNRYESVRESDFENMKRLLELEIKMEKLDMKKLK